MQISGCIKTVRSGFQYNAIFGIEGLRALITRDSVKILDKQNKLYTARSIGYLQEVSALPVNLSTLQDLIIGNAVFVDSNIISYSKFDNSISSIKHRKDL